MEFRMTKRSYSRYTLDAIGLLGRMVRLGRIERKMTAQELADRVGISRSLLQRIEKGDPKCELGAALEAAAIVGVPLFTADVTAMALQSRGIEEKLALLPKYARTSVPVVKDEF